MCKWCRQLLITCAIYVIYQAIYQLGKASQVVDSRKMVWTVKREVAKRHVEEKIDQLISSKATRKMKRWIPSEEFLFKILVIFIT